jgi:hypothetical protein
MKRMRLGVAASLCSVAALSCAADGSEPGAYVLLDQEARQAGVSLEVGDHVVESALPIAVSPDDHILLHNGATEEPLTVARGELVYIEGTGGKVTHLRLGKDVAPDELRVTGEEAAAKDLAGQLGAKVDPDDAGWRLHVPGVFTGAALARVPERLRSVAPVLPSEASPAPGSAGALARAPAVVAAAAQAPAPTAVPDVAAVTSPASVGSPWPVAFVPAAAACPGVAGQWRGRVYSDWHGAYYDFVLTVAQTGSTLKGKVAAEFWDATAEQVEPPNACAQARQHVKVVESASGSVDADGTMRFASSSWHVASHLCGERVTDYSVDRFEVPLADGATTAHAVASDDVVWVQGTPLELTRVSCR